MTGLRVVVVLAGLATVFAPPASAFPRLDAALETVLVGPGVPLVQAATRGQWTLAPDRVAPRPRRALMPHHWFPSVPAAQVADGFLRARLEARRGLKTTLVFRAELEKPSEGPISGYGLEISGRKLRLYRLDRDLRRRLVADRTVRRLTTVEVAIWMIGPQVTVHVYDGTTLAQVAALAFSDSTYPSGGVGMVVHGRRADEQALGLLTVRRAGAPAGARRVPIGEHRYLAVSRTVHDGLGPELAALVDVVDSREDPLVVRTDAAGHERLLRADVDHRWLERDTPYKYVDPDLATRLGREPEPTDRGFAIDGSFKDAAMVEALLRAYQARYGAISRVVELGHSREGRPVLGLRISGAGDAATSVPAVLLNGAHHGSELLSIEFVLDAVKRLLEGYGRDDRVTRWVDGLEIWCVPLVNPDGNHSFVHRSIYAGRRNVGLADDGPFDPAGGVDLNRNYPFRWGALGERGSRSNPRSPYYRGPAPGSEPETRAMMRLTDSAHFAASISYHTVSNVILVPYTTDGVTQPRIDEAWHIAKEIARVVPRQPTGRPMGVARNIYPVDGVDQDHFRAAHGTVALLVEGAVHNPRSTRLRTRTVASTRPTWEALFDRVLAGPVIRGRVLDREGAPLSAEVVVREQEPRFGEVWTSRCRDGRFDRLVTQPGPYTVLVRAPGYLPRHRKVELRPGEAADVTITLDRDPEAEASSARLCGDPALLSIDQACACERGQCAEPGPPRWCRVEGTCHEVGAQGPAGEGRCDPSQSQISWSSP